MPLQTSIYKCKDKTGLADTLLQRISLCDETGFKVTLQPDLSVVNNSEICLIVATMASISTPQKCQQIKAITARTPTIVALIDYTDDNAAKFFELGAKEVLPLKGISPQLFHHAMHLHATRVKKKETSQVVNQQLGALLDRIPFNLLMTDPNGKVVFSNKGGKRFIEQQDGITIKTSGTLCLDDEHEQKHLLDKIKKIAAGDEEESQNSSLRYLYEEDQIVIIVLPLKGSEGKSGTAIFLRNEKEEAHLNEEVLKSLYGLTSAETKLALLLTNGYSLSEIADLNEVSQHTVRTQLKNIYSKTGMNRQTDLIKAIITGPASLRSI